MFNKDLLLIDIESTGLDDGRHEIIQLAAVLLDKKTLREKKAFTSYIKPTKWKNRDPEAMAVCKITWDMVKDAPSLKTTLGTFSQHFPKNVILSYYGGPMDMDFLRAAFKKSGLNFHFDYHYLNLWPIFYSYFAVKNKLTNKHKFTGF